MRCSLCLDRKVPESPNELRFDSSVLTPRRVFRQLWGPGLVLLGVCICGVHGAGWAFVALGAAVAVLGVGALAYVAGLQGSEDRKNQWTTSTRNRAIMLFAGFSPMSGSILIAVGLFV